MSSAVQNKLLSIEIPPPSNVWDKIAAELDDADADHQYARKLYPLAIQPPAVSWNKIAGELDDADLEQQYPSKLYELAVLPPATIWDKISASLDATVPSTLVAEKLVNYEVVPPVTTWNKIVTALDAENEAAIPERRRLSPFIKYAAAAAVIALLAWGGATLLGGKKQTGNIVKQEVPVPHENTDHAAPVSDERVDQPTNTQDEEAVAQNDEARNDAALEASKKTYAKLEINNNSKIKEAANFYFAAPQSRGLTFGGEEDAVPVYTKEEDRYIVLMTPDGNIIRMSKKLGNLVCCVSGEEQDKECKDQMKKWREQIASSPAGHSPGNFMDILSLLNTLQDDDQF